MKLWQKSTDSLKEVNLFTAGQDSKMDEFLIKADLWGSLAHVQMLGEAGLLSAGETKKLLEELKKLLSEAESGNFKIEDGVEDVHSQVELELTRRLGDVGKKIHSGRSRNDQVLTDIKLFLREEIRLLAIEIRETFNIFLDLSVQHREKLLPGYTHLQLAMPSSFGLWFGAYAESLADDLISLQGAYRYANRNPLGSAAGYGSSFPLNRDLTSKLLGFEAPHINVVNAQMSRGKTEKITAQALSNIAATLSKMAMDSCLYMNPNFGFISFPQELTTGSSIMPHKKNPDVFELVRARCNQLQSLPSEITNVLTNLPSGYHRDLQVIKEILFPAFAQLKDCLEMMRLMFSSVRIREGILEDQQYKFLFSVEEVNKLVLQGIPFRDAYRQVGEIIESGAFSPTGKVNHTHLGSIGNTGTERIRAYFDNEFARFNFDYSLNAIRELTS
ncbi:MAG: argininosuccinate lyase [Cyclobacteriaceae bacterium]